MALVAYDYGSGSEDEGANESEDSSAVTINIAPDQSKATNTGTSSLEANASSTNNNNEEKVPELLSHLPKTKESVSVNIIEDKLEDFVPKYQATKQKKPTQKVKITIPALSEFDEDDEPQQKKRKTPAKGSSLLSMLPPVRGTIISATSFLPKVLKNKPPLSESKNSLVPHAVRKKAEEMKKATLRKITKTDSGSDLESDDDFEIPESYDDEMWQKVCGPKSKPKPAIIEPEQESVVAFTEEINIAPEATKPYDGLDNAAFKELVGKAKRPVNIKLVDINEEEIVADKDVWLTRALTDPEIEPKAAVDNPVDPTRKKKHHITYLAEQAKANEQDLQTQWSSNKFARNQTRAKYGF